MKIAIIDYGAGNVFSVQMALKRLGYEACLTHEAGVIKEADRVIFPGVGQASVAMQHLKGYGLDLLIPELKMPVLGICLGMQLMCAHTEEEDTAGLGIFPLRVLQMRAAEKIPHMGWNNLTGLDSPLFEGVEEGERMYFVHSFYVPESGYGIARCDYYGGFSAAIRRENFYGCQFHPEKSAAAGERVLLNFINV